jgi:uncharacterized membrane protein YtjA (UPF0391 family)
MLGWAIGFFLAAIVAAVFGFGGIASAFAGIAVILFWVFVALFVLSLVFSFARGGAHAGHVAVAGEPVVGHGPNFGGLGLIAAVAVVAILAYAWVKNDWSATEVGQNIDRTASRVTADAGEVIENAGDRAENLVENTEEDLRNDEDKNN